MMNNTPKTILTITKTRLKECLTRLEFNRINALDDTIPYNLPKATIEPLRVIEPMNTPK